MINNGESIGLYEYLSAYLSFSMKEDAAKEVARRLEEHYGSLRVMSSSSYAELLEIDGLNRQSAMSLKLLGYLYSRSVTDAFKLGKSHTEQQIEEYLSALYTGLSVETVYCLLTDSKGRVIASEYMGEGTINSSEIYPRRILECAVRHSAKCVIIAHNHPKGASEPSNEDKFATEYIKCVLRDAGIKLIAHYLISEDGCTKVEIE